MINRGRLANISEPGVRRHKPDYVILLCSVMLAGLGLIAVYAMSPGLSAANHVSEKYYISKQLIAVAIGLLVFGFAATRKPNTIRKARLPLLVAAVAAAIAVQLFGREVNGAYRWIQIAGFSFQAVELIKLALIVFVAEFLSRAKELGDLASWQKTTKLLLAIVVIIGVVVAGLESDLGSAMVMVGTVGLMAYLAGVPMRKLLLVGAAVVTLLFVAISISPYRRDRLATYINPSSDCQGSGYQACQALITIGSGGILGKGIGNSVQAYGYLPEAANDSIFAIMAETFGFLGVSVLLGLYTVFFARIRRVIEGTTNLANRLIAAGILAWLSLQAIINIASMLGLMPLKGITLPFISYGGTSLIFVMAAAGIVFQLSRYTTYETSERRERDNKHGYIPMRRGDRRPYYTPLGRRS